jgi:beta-1,4-mannooligosaccharide/beta-1,4-mannosyl-N-acetylglucosamine phosphorylase
MTDSGDQKGPFHLFRRYENNPILTAESWPYPANAVFNPGAAQVGNETLLLARVEDMSGFSHLTSARSRDGKTDWQIDAQPTLEPDRDREEWIWGVEDPRIVWFAEREEYVITYVCFSVGGPVVSLALTRDFEVYTRLGPLVPPEDKDASLFPRLIGGRYALIHRPIIRGEGHIWISFSPDLEHWGGHRILLTTRPGWWDSHRIGLGAPPIETPEGWLLIYHGVRMTASGSLYRVGLALLDLEEPWKTIRRCSEWVFGAKESYERIGDVPGVTFPTGAIWLQDSNEVRVYYGAADTSVALAVADMGELLEYLKRCAEPAAKG